MTSNALSWPRALRQTLRPPADGRPPRLAIVGVGQPLRGDDGAGPALAQRLVARLTDEALLILDAGPAPENCLGPIVRFRPDVVLFLDVAQGGGAPGDLVWLRPDEADSLGLGTHGLSLEMLAGYLSAETGATVHVLGIEPADLGHGERLSPAVDAATRRAATVFVVYWRKLRTVCSAMASGEASVVNT